MVKESVEVKDPEKEELRQEVIKELNHVQDIQRRVPKFGFKNINRKEYNGINLDVLQDMVDKGRIKDNVNLEILIENRLAHKNDLVKILGRGELKAKLNITAHKFTASAKEAIEKAGGKTETL